MAVRDFREECSSVLTFVPKSADSSEDSFTTTAPVPGRVLRVAASFGNFRWFHWNIHNFGLTLNQVAHVSEMILADAGA